MNKDEKGKTSVQKLGVGAKQRDGFEYEFTCTFLIDQKTNTAESQKDNTHLFDHEGAKILTEADGVKIIKWANSGEGYTPVEYKKSDVEKAELDIADLKKEIVNLCVELGGQKNEKLMAALKAVVPNGNPNSIKSVDKAKGLLETLKAMK